MLKLLNQEALNFFILCIRHLITTPDDTGMEIQKEQETYMYIKLILDTLQIRNLISRYKYKLLLNLCSLFATLK